MRPLKLSRPLVIFDLETTGPNPHEDRIVEIAMVTLHPDGRRERWEERVNPERPIPPSATAVHGISDADVADAPRFAEVAPRVVALLDNRDVGGFNAARFDIPLLQRELDRVKVALPAQTRLVVDAQVVFHRMEPRDLSAAVRVFCGHDHAGAHGAMADAEATLDVLLAQVERYSEPEASIPDSVEELAEFCSRRDDRFIDPEGKFQWEGDEPIIGFGKHRGILLREMAARSPDYLEWILRKDFSDEAKAIARDALSGKFPEK